MIANLMQIVPLELMTPGEHGRICELDGSPEFVVRLQEMGLQEGASIRMVKTGSPCILAINDHRLSLRFDDRATVLVEVTR
jgi:ferrous iron transport protein A